MDAGMMVSNSCFWERCFPASEACGSPLPQAIVNVPISGRAWEMRIVEL